MSGAQCGVVWVHVMTHQIAEVATEDAHMPKIVASKKDEWQGGTSEEQIGTSTPHCAHTFPCSSVYLPPAQCGSTHSHIHRVGHECGPASYPSKRAFPSQTQPL